MAALDLNLGGEEVYPILPNTLKNYRYENGRRNGLIAPGEMVPIAEVGEIVYIR